MKTSPRTPPRRYHAHETDRMQELDGSELASFTRRALALFLDLLFAGVLCLTLVLAFSAVTSSSGGAPGDQRMKVHYERIKISELLHHGEAPASEPQAAKVDLKLNFFGNGFSVVYLTLFIGFSNFLGNGRTLGKRIAGIRAVSLVHPKLGLWHSFERALGYGASALELGFGFIQYFLHPNRRTVHDRIAETIVVRERPKAG